MNDAFIALIYAGRVPPGPIISQRPKAPHNFADDNTISSANIAIEPLKEAFEKRVKQRLIGS